MNSIVRDQSREMDVVFQDMQEPDSSMSGARLGTPGEIDSLFRSLSGRKPFLFELRGSNGFMLTIGYGSDCGSVQHSSSEGLPPYLMATTDDFVDDDGVVTFLAGGTPTPIPRRFCLPKDRVQSIARDFLIHGKRSNTVEWEEI